MKFWAFPFQTNPKNLDPVLDFGLVLEGEKASEPNKYSSIITDYCINPNKRPCSNKCPPAFFSKKRYVNLHNLLFASTLKEKNLLLEEQILFLYELTHTDKGGYK